MCKKVDIRDLSEDERKAARKEAVILNALNHPGIIRHVESFEEDGFLNIVAEFCERGDLGNRIEERRGVLLPETAVLAYFVELALAMLYVHKKRLLHR